MSTDKHGLNTEVRDSVFSLSANGVGEEGWGEVARKAQIPLSYSSPRFGGVRGKTSCHSEFIRGNPW
jgi:hypothetical protein